jgi:hypothetical protein
MSEEIPELGEIAYTGYFKASDGKSLISGAPLPAWDEQAPEVRQAWNLAAMAVVDRWSEPGDDDPELKPEPAKVIIVTEIPIGDRPPVERRYAAVTWTEHVDHVLEIRADEDEERKGRVATYQPNAWLSVREDGALMPDSTALKLANAMRALRVIAGTVLEKSDERREVVAIARDALEQITDEDL